MPTRIPRPVCVKVALTDDEYERLEAAAFAEDREAPQHARYLIRCALVAGHRIGARPHRLGDSADVLVSLPANATELGPTVEEAPA